MSPRLFFLILALALPASLPGLAPASPPVKYRIELDKEGRDAGRVHVSTREQAGKRTLYLTVQFKILRADNGALAIDVAKDEIIVEEDRRRVAGLEIHQPAALDPLTTVLAIDVSGSMADQGKMDEARHAARLFLDKLHANADCGLILFDHEIHDPLPPAGNPMLFKSHRQQLRERIEAAQPGGGTAYLDATYKAIEMLRNVGGRRAILLMTDGVDLNSRRTFQEVVKMAQATDVPVYTLGVGDPGKQEPVTTVLVLDHSGSMRERADTGDKVRKIDALHRAASQFVTLMRPGARTTLLPFSETVDSPAPFSADREALVSAIKQLRPSGETALFDAAYTAVEMLEATRPEGRRAVVVLTDGIDNRSRHRVEEVIDRAREAKVPLYMLGLGRPGELDFEVMARMANSTGGQFYPVRNQQELYKTFEKLSFQLHDDGIDEPTLQQLAEQTGGKYYQARNVSQLTFIYQQLAEELQNTYTATFPSRRQSHDGTARGIDISVVRDGVRLSDVASVDYAVHGVVVPEMDHRVYLGLLAVLGGLLAIPAGFRRLLRGERHQ